MLLTILFGILTRPNTYYQGFQQARPLTLMLSKLQITELVWIPKGHSAIMSSESDSAQYLGNFKSKMLCPHQQLKFGRQVIDVHASKFSGYKRSCQISKSIFLVSSNLTVMMPCMPSTTFKLMIEGRLSTLFNNFFMTYIDMIISYIKQLYQRKLSLTSSKKYLSNCGISYWQIC